MPVGVVEVGVLQEAEEVRLRGLDDILQPPVGKGAVADKVDAAHRRLAAFVDLEDQIDAVVRALDDLRRRPARRSGRCGGRCRRCAARRPAPSVRENVPRGFDWISALSCSSLTVPVALELDAVDDRVLDHGHDQAAARLADPHVLEQAGRVERLEALVDLDRVKPFARARRKYERIVSASTRRLPSTTIWDGGCALRPRTIGRRKRRSERTDTYPAEDNADRPALATPVPTVSCATRPVLIARSSVRQPPVPLLAARP